MRLDAHVVRVFDEQRAVVLDLERDGRRRRVLAPGVFPVPFDEIVIQFPVDLLRLEVAVLQKFRVQAAVQRVIDILQKQPCAARADGDLSRFMQRDLHIQPLSVQTFGCIIAQNLPQEKRP